MSIVEISGIDKTYRLGEVEVEALKERDLDIPEVEKSWWKLGGYLEGRYLGRLTREGSYMGRLKLRSDDSGLEHDGRARLSSRGPWVWTGSGSSS
ncbi:MAG: hypothetical protein JRJ59_04885 [Deltaproteobacteria bacterium]|nr:hypothetical protein [Deltaproteobacteria bacterium]